MAKDAGRGWDWAGLPVIATVARLLCRELTLQNEYLRLENRILKGKTPGRLRFTANCTTVWRVISEGGGRGPRAARNSWK